MPGAFVTAGKRAIVSFTIRRPDEEPVTYRCHVDTAEKYTVEVAAGTTVCKILSTGTAETRNYIIAAHSTVEGVTLGIADAAAPTSATTPEDPVFELRPFMVSDHWANIAPTGTNPIAVILTNSTAYDATVTIFYAGKPL